MIQFSGISHALKTVQRFSDVEEKMQEIAERLCAVGEPIIKQIHGNHAVVKTEKTAKGYKITASGEDVLFIEFGAGDAAGSENANYKAVPASARPGSWSEAHGGQYALTKKTGGQGYWFFGGHLYTEVKPSPAFYYAYEYMLQSLPQIAREVFGS